MKTLEFHTASSQHLQRKSILAEKKKQPISVASTLKQKASPTKKENNKIPGKKDELPNILKMQISVNEATAGLTELHLQTNAGKLTLLKPEDTANFNALHKNAIKNNFGKKTASSFFAPQVLPNTPQFFFDNPAKLATTKVEELTTLKKQGASSLRFRLLVNLPHSKQNRLELQVTYSLNWLAQLHISYKLQTLQDCPLMFIHPLFLSLPAELEKNHTTNNANTENTTLKQIYKNPANTTINALMELSRYFVVKNNTKDGLQKIITAQISKKKPLKDLFLHVFSSTTSLEYYTIKNTSTKNIQKNKNMMFYINCFNGFADTIAGKAVGTGSARSDFSFSLPSALPFSPYGSFSPYILKKGAPFHFQTVLQFSKQEKVI